MPKENLSFLKKREENIYVKRKFMCVLNEEQYYCMHRRIIKLYFVKLIKIVNLGIQVSSVHCQVIPCTRRVVPLGPASTILQHRRL